MKRILLAVVFLQTAAICSAATGSSGKAYQYYLKALLLESQGNFAAAKEEVTLALQEAPESAYLHRTAAELSLRTGQVEEAGREIEKAIELDPKDVRALIVAGQVQWSLGNTDKAVERLRRALDLNPDEAEALVSLAGAVSPKNPDEAIRLYKEYLERHPNELEIMERLAQVYQSKADVARAKTTWEDILAAAPNSARAHLSLAQIAEVQYDTFTAISHYEGVLSQDPTNLPLLLRIGELRYRNNDMTKAAEAFTRAQAIAPNSASANFWLALLAENRGDWDSAIKLLKNVKEGEQEPGVLLRLSYYYSQNRQYKEAVGVLKKLVETDPSNTDFLNYLSVAYEQAGQPADAEKTLKQILEIDPNDAEGHFHLATLYDRTKRFQLAEQELKTAIKLKPDFHMALNYLGYSYADRNINLDEAERLVNDAIAFEPQNPAYLDSMGWVYFRLGKLDKAKDFLQEASARINDPVIWEHYGDVRMAAGSDIDALLAWDEGLRADPKSKTLRAKINKAMKRISKGDKVSLFMKRALNNFGDIASVQSLTKITVCQGKPCFNSNAQFGYERGLELKAEIPGPMSSPVMVVVKKPKKPAEFGALHPQFQTVQPYVTSAFERIYSLLTADGFKQMDVAELGRNPTEKSGRLAASAGHLGVVFDANDGRVLSLGFKGDRGDETLSLGNYSDEKSEGVPPWLEWADAASGVRLRVDFLKPTVAAGALGH